MKTPKDKSYTTKSGLDIELKYKPFVEDRKGLNSMWDLHEITALIDGEEVGYVRVSYVPKERSPNIFEFASIQGQHSISRAYKSGDERKLATEISRYYDMSVINNLYSWERGTWKHEWSSSPPPPENMDKWWEETIDRMKKLYVDRTKQYYNDFIRYWVNKPLIDFINVEREFQRKGIGVVLYLAAGKWMNMNGMRLYASGTQSNSAKSSWEYLKKHHDVKSVKTTHGRKRITRFYIGS